MKVDLTFKGNLSIPGIYLMEFEGTVDSYIGQSGDPLRRIMSHAALLRKGRHHSEAFNKVLYGREAVSIKVSLLEECLDGPTRCKREAHWISQKNPTLNINHKGSSVFISFRISMETMRKLLRVRSAMGMESTPVGLFSRSMCAIEVEKILSVSGK